MRAYLRVAFNRVPSRKQQDSFLTRAVFQAISLPARWRLDHNFHSFPVELWLKNAAGRVLAPPKPKVDAHQLSSEPVTC